MAREVELVCCMTEASRLRLRRNLRRFVDSYRDDPEGFNEEISRIIRRRIRRPASDG